MGMLLRENRETVSLFHFSVGFKATTRGCNVRQRKSDRWRSNFRTWRIRVQRAALAASRDCYLVSPCHVTLMECNSGYSEILRFYGWSIASEWKASGLLLPLSYFDAQPASPVYVA